MNQTFNIWEGVYPTFLDAKDASVGFGFEGDIYRKRVLDAASECLKSIASGTPIPSFHKQRSTMLPPVVAMMLRSKDDLTILDFGGGLAIGYMTLLECIPAAEERIDYTIVEIEGVCDQGRQIFKNNVKFQTKIPLETAFDLIHSASALQYVENWKETLENLCSNGKEYILLSDVFAGEIDTFVTLQNYYGSKIPHWFINLQELISVMGSSGYTLEMKSSVSSKRLTSEDILPMDNFPTRLQLMETLHLLFRRRTG